MTRRTSKLADDDYRGTLGDTSASAPRTAPLDQLAPNPGNPRDDDLDVEELAASFEEIGQLQSAAVVSRPVFLAVYPQYADDIAKSARWVVINGNRRLAAARKAGLSELKIDVSDQLGVDDDRIDDAVIIENIHRQNLPPLREAAHLARMIKRHGSQRKLAKRIGKTQAYVSQRLSLLDLLPELQEALSAGTINVTDARKLAIQPEDDQRSVMRALDSLIPELREALADGSINLPTARELGDLESDQQRAIAMSGPPYRLPVVAAQVANDDDAQLDEETPVGDNRVITGRSERPRNSGSGQSLVIRVPLHAPEELATAIRAHLAPDELQALVRLLTE
jgi:ParB/RepB/Spo0J family partition protein